MSSPSTSPTLKRRAGSAPVAHLFKPPRSQRDFFTGRKQRKHANNTALRRDVFLRKTQLQPLPEIRFTLDDGDDSDDETTDSPPITRVMSGGPALQYALDPTAALRLLAHVPIRAPEETQSSAAYFMLERMRHADEHNPGGGWLLDGMRMGKTQVRTHARVMCAATPGQRLV
jgi:hypothetical protein